MMRRVCCVQGILRSYAQQRVMMYRPSSEWNSKSQRPLILALALQPGDPLLVALNQSLA